MKLILEWLLLSAGGSLLGGFRGDQPAMTLVQGAFDCSCLLGVMHRVPFETFIHNDIELRNSFKPGLFVDSRAANKLSYNSCTVCLPLQLHS